MKSSKNKMCVQHIFGLYVQIPYGIPVYVQIPCLLFLKPPKWPKIADFEENGIFTIFASFYYVKISFLKCTLN